METNNKLREAVQTLLSEIGGYSADGLEVVWCGISGEAIRKARAALAEPVKNCEVGTEKEQMERFTEICNQRRLHHKCPPGSCACCAIAWAQMTYKEGGAK